ncbi:transmembrane protein 192-like [Apostichopus japonicus]|uniref:transmembrane protein 192-like n=1 Tax=Stichopus japonicus TaxID=307972 RepID=UPI003AB53802
MVSLGTDGERQGAYFFDQEVNPGETHDDEEVLLVSDVHLVSSGESNSKPIRTVFVAVLQMILIFLFLLIIILFPYVFEKFLHPDDKPEKQLRYGLAVIVYSQITVFVCLALMERYLHMRHRESLRQGYLEFYRDTQRMKRIPAYTFAAGNAIFLLSLMVTLDLNWGSGQSWSGPRGLPVYFCQAVGLLECIVASVGSMKYAVKVFKFNKRREQPDVEQEEAVAAAMQPSIHIPDVGFRDTNYVDNLLEKQADLIHYLKQHTVYLNNLIVKLKNGTAQSQALSSIS